MVQAISFRSAGWLEIVARMNNVEFQENAGTRMLIGIQMDRMIEG